MREKLISEEIIWVVKKTMEGDDNHLYRDQLTI